jgi:hypothetical protein
MGRVCKVFVIAAVMSIMIVLGAGPAFAANGGDFPHETSVCENAPGHPDLFINIGTRIDTPSAADPCVPADSVGRDDDIIFE